MRTFVPQRTKPELLQVGILFLVHLFNWEILLMKKLETEETKATWQISDVSTSRRIIWHQLKTFIFLYTGITACRYYTITTWRLRKEILHRQISEPSTLQRIMDLTPTKNIYVFKHRWETIVRTLRTSPTQQRNPGEHGN